MRMRSLVHDVGHLGPSLKGDWRRSPIVPLMDPFSILGIARTFAVDLPEVERRHRELSSALHPDKYAQSTAWERRATLSKAVLVNEAWRVVRDPVRRAEALFSLAGVAIGERNEPPANPEFLMNMMEQREELSRIKAERNRKDLELLLSSVQANVAKIEGTLARAFSNGHDASALSLHVGRLGELRFYRRLVDEAETLIAEWDDGVA